MFRKKEGERASVRKRARERVCVYVCVRERHRQNMSVRDSAHESYMPPFLDPALRKLPSAKMVLKMEFSCGFLSTNLSPEQSASR